jgi:hypothetical protein
MKKWIAPLCLAAVVMLGTGCVTRTVTDQPQYRGNSSTGTKHGSKNETGKVVSEKRVWFWQSDF